MNNHMPRRIALKTLAATICTAPSVFAQQPKHHPQPEHPWPMTGHAHRDLATFDEMMTRFVHNHQVPGAALAITKDSHLIYARGFGWADVESHRPVQPDSLFRIASISKPFTAVAVLQLAAASKFKLHDHVFDVLPAKEWLTPSHDKRLRVVTIQQLLQHTGGWDRDKSFDPIGRLGEVAKFLMKVLPVSARDVVQYTLTLPLDFDPGTRYAYSNVGYLLLGRLIEHASGQKYENYVRQHVLRPVGVTRMQLGRAWKEALAKDEVHYYDALHRVQPAVNGPHLGAKVPIVYGGENFEGFEAHGGWIASAVDLVKFASAFDHTSKANLLPQAMIAAMWARPEGPPGYERVGKPKPAYYGCGWNVRPIGNRGRANTWHTGLIAGTSTLLVRRHDGLNWAVLFNTDQDAHKKTLPDLIDPLVHETADSIKRWPAP